MEQKLLIFILLLVGFVLLFLRMGGLSAVYAGLLKKGKELNAAARQRNLADRQNLLKLQETHSFWYRLEQQLTYSGLRRYFPNLSAEWWLTGNLVLGVLCFVGISIPGGILLGMTVAAGAFALEWILLSGLRRRNLKRTEEDLTKLLDFLGNYSVSSGEITGIFDQIARYMDEPIKGVLTACYYEATTTGDSSTALITMAEKVEHPKFKELVRNMEISTRYCADFSILVNSSRRSLRDYLHTVQERSGMVREAYVNLFLLAAMSFIVLLSVGNLTGTEMVPLLTRTWPGRIGLGLLIFIFLLFQGKVNRLD